VKKICPTSRKAIAKFGIFLAIANIMCLLTGIKRTAAAILLGAVALYATDAQKPVTVMIDPGHGGNAFGALGPKVAPKKKGVKAPERLAEKKVSLQLAKLLGAQLEGMGYVIHYTRTNDIAVPLLDRARAANRVGADVFVSLHLNAYPNKMAKGSEVFFLSIEPVLDQELQALADAENENENGQGAAEQDFDIVAGILEDLAQKAYLQESEKMAVFIQAELNRLAGIKERGVKQAPFAVLRAAAMPAVLVETAFISNPSEAAKLRDPAFLSSAADAIARGIQLFIEATCNGRARRKAPA
jgi:N-acetylmuramoyl-L-alanine amidase